MLALDDPRWAQLTTFFGSPSDLPRKLEEWLASIGSDQEETVYARELHETYLHQGTITNAAYAVVPWLIVACKNHPTNNRAYYLVDVAWVEANRIKWGLYFNRKGTEETPNWLMSDYRNAIIEARNLMEDAIDMEVDDDWKKELMAVKPALFGNADAVWSRDD